MYQRIVIGLACVIGLGQSARAEGVDVTASLPPLALIAGEIVRDRGEVSVLGSGGHAHGGSLSPSERRALDGADIVVWIGPDLEPAVAAALGERASGSLALGEGAADPHVWLSPERASAMAEAITDALAALDPEAGEQYRAAADALLARIREAGEAARARLEPYRDAVYVVEHDAYGPFAADIGLMPAIALAPAEGRRVGPRRLREVAALAAERGARCLIAEPGTGTRLAELLGLKRVEIDPLGVRADDFPDLIERVADGFAQCLSR